MVGGQLTPLPSLEEIDSFVSPEGDIRDDASLIGQDKKKNSYSIK